MNYLEPLVTFIVGTFAIGLYIKQKRDKKRDAASILLLEIKSAERKIKAAKDKQSERLDLSDDLPLIQNESWSKYKYLFVKDLDRDEWDSINDFYEKCGVYDEAVTNGRLSFSKNEEQIRINAHRIFADYIKEAIEEVTVSEPDEMQDVYQKVKTKAQVFSDTYLTNNEDFTKPMYTPQKYMDDRNRQLNLIDPHLSTGSVGMKLKRIARIEV